MMSVNPYCYFDNPTVENLESLMNQQLEEITGQFENKIADLEEQLAQKEPQAKQQKPLNSLASFVTSYNLPQVAALILGISFEYIHITRQTAQIDENEFSYDIVIKFDKLLQSLIAIAKSGQLQGLTIAYYEPYSYPIPAWPNQQTQPQQPQKQFDYLNSVIEKASLETYLKSIGRDLCQLLELQEPLTQTPPPDSSELVQQVATQQAIIDRQAQEITELKAKLEQAGKAQQPSDTPATYTTKAITALNHVIAEFWQNWEVGTKPPKQEYIEAWIIENYPTINKTTAKTIDRLARHESVK